MADVETLTPWFGSANCSSGPATTTPPPVSSVHIPIIVNDAGSPTRQEIQVLGENDVFESTTTAAAQGAAPNPASQRIMRNLRGPATNFFGFAPRADRVNQIPSAANAQGIYSPEALIFVAK